MNQATPSITNRMEELFLSILRIVVLFVLAASILAAACFAIAGMAELSAKSKEFKYQSFDHSQWVIDLQESLRDPSPAQTDTPTKSAAPAASPLEDEIAKQTTVLVDFYKKYDFDVNPSWLNEQVKPRLRKQALSFSTFYGEGDAALLQYASGQTQLLKMVLLSGELDPLLDKKFKSQGDLDGDEKYQPLHEFVNKVLAVYPDFHEAQLTRKRAFESEQGAELGARRADALVKLYLAAGAFAAFLLISLFLLLVKIERNLRTSKGESIGQH